MGVALVAALLASGTAAWLVLHRQSPPSTGTASARAASQQTPKGPRVAGDDDQLVGETYPDGTSVHVGEHLVKTWELRNTGTVPWHKRSLVRQGPSTPADGCPTAARVSIADTPPGHVAAVSVPLTARRSRGTCRSSWKMVDASGRQSFPAKTGVYLLLPVTP